MLVAVMLLLTYAVVASVVSSFVVVTAPVVWLVADGCSVGDAGVMLLQLCTGGRDSPTYAYAVNDVLVALVLVAVMLLLTYASVSSLVVVTAPVVWNVDAVVIFTCGRDSPCGLECGCSCTHGRSIGASAGASASGAICRQGCAGCTDVGCCHAAAYICCGGFSGVFIRGRDSPCGLECGWGCADGCSVGDAGDTASGAICCQGCAGCTGVGCCHAAAHICRSGFSGVFTCGRALWFGMCLQLYSWS